MTEYLVALVLLIGSMVFSYNTGKKVKDGEHKEEMIDAITNAKKARAKLSDDDYVKWLRNKRKQLL